jgi:hypothetical protein
MYVVMCSMGTMNKVVYSHHDNRPDADAMVNYARRKKYRDVRVVEEETIAPGPRTAFPQLDRPAGRDFESKR